MSTNAPERYPVKPSPYSSHSRIVALAGDGHGRSLLDVGCARGHLGARLKDCGWRVVGIEPDPADARVAEESGLQVVVGDAESALAGVSGTFDAVIFADVLEHLVDPRSVLESAGRLLSDGAKVYISVPNIAHLSVRVQLLFGRFTYTDRGILDRTHLHFYTRRSLLDLVETSGFRVVRIMSTPAPVEEVFPVLARRSWLRPVLALNAFVARVWKSAFAYQYIAVVARP